MSKRYIASIMRKNRGHGLVSIFAKSATEAKNMAQSLAKKNGCECCEITPFTAFERKVRRIAVNDLIWRNSPLLHTR